MPWGATQVPRAVAHVQSIPFQFSDLGPPPSSLWLSLEWELAGAFVQKPPKWAK